MRSRSGWAIRAALTAVAALAGALLLGASTPPQAHAFGVQWQQFQRPALSFPLASIPEYGDGLGAGRGHEGVDLFAAAGTPLLAVSDSIVVESGSDGGRGNYVSIYDLEADQTYNYLHMIAPALVAPGDRVTAGQKLGELGCTGSCWGDHLHFEVRSGRTSYGPVLDPLPLLERLARARG